jgi:hypothetical protein
MKHDTNGQKLGNHPEACHSDRAGAGEEPHIRSGVTLASLRYVIASGGGHSFRSGDVAAFVEQVLRLFFLSK